MANMVEATPTFARAVEAFRAMEPVADVLEALRLAAEGGDTQWLSLEYQARVMSDMVYDRVCDQYPPQHKYICRFLKRYMEEIEVAGADASDELVEGLMEFVLAAPIDRDALDTDDMHYVSFTVPSACHNTKVATGESVITCRVASVFNDVGLKIWEAGWFLAEYVISHADEFNDRSVLELGAGVGFTGLALAVAGKPSHVLLTDYAPNVMQNLRYNVEINASAVHCPVTVQVLDWDTWEPTGGDASKRPDVILAGDCVYDVDAFPAMMRVLDAFLGPPDNNARAESEAGGARSAIFAATIRNQKTFQAFLDQLAAHQISYVDITAAALDKMGTQRYRYENRDQIRLCRLSRSGGVESGSAEQRPTS